MHPRDFIEVLEDPRLPRCAVTGEQAELLRAVLVQLFFVDHDFDARELALFERIMPPVNIREYITSMATRKVDLHRLAELFPDPKDRDDILTLAEHAVWGDDRVQRREWDLIDRLAETLGVERD